MAPMRDGGPATRSAGAGHGKGPAEPDPSGEALGWWFAMDYSRLAGWLQHPAPSSIPPHRLTLLRQLARAQPDETALADLHDRCLAAGDWEAACAAAGAGITLVWDSGYGFDRFGPWLDRIDKLLEEAPADRPLVRASLLGFRANAQMNWQGDIHAASATCRQQLLAAESARSRSLRIHHAALQTYCHLWLGNLTAAGLLLEDTAYLRSEDRANWIPQVFLDCTRGLYHTINGEPDTGRILLQELSAHPDMERLPSSLWLLVLSNLLFATANCEDQGTLPGLVERICLRAVPQQNAFHHSYLHFSQGVAALALGHPAEALAHAQQAIDHGVAAQSAVTARMPVLLKGQALADLGREVEALALFGEWLPTWRMNGFCTVAATASQEAARIELRRGNREEARCWYRQAQDCVPDGERLPLFHRPRHLAEKLGGLLSPRATTLTGTPLVRIHCLGDFRVEISDRVFHDQNWRGGRTKKLLKALIVLGGKEVGQEGIADLLWPGAEGDRARGNLKVAIWRLRRLGVDAGDDPRPWLLLRSGHLSLADGLCEVDALRFVSALRSALHQRVRNWYGIREALRLYSGPFLPADCTETWIIGHRERLQRYYLEGVLALALSARDMEQKVSSQPYLRRALDLDPLDERLYLQLMHGYLAQGCPAKALEVYHRAQATLKQGLATAPGPALTELASRISNHT